MREGDIGSGVVVVVVVVVTVLFGKGMMSGSVLIRCRGGLVV